MKVGRAVTGILRAVVALRTSDAENEAMPERWPENPYPGDRVRLKPPSDIEAAEQRLANAETEGYECEDKWHCHRELSE